jgi:hypothetical protein
MSAFHRGPRSTGCIDFATAAWQRNEFGVDVLTLSRDPVCGAITFALRTPAGLAYPEVEHFYDCDEDLFQFEGEFRHDDLVSYRTNDYVYRPIGTVYGNKVGSEGGTIVASLAREPVRFHFQGHPGPWNGHYLVDQRWNPRPVAPSIVRSNAAPWTPSELDAAIAYKLLRGTPGVRSIHSGASAHSPWAADAALLLKIEAGFHGTFPAWPRTALECLVAEGLAECAGVSWKRGCYTFDGLRGPVRVEQTLVVYVRAFVDPQ